MEAGETFAGWFTESGAPVTQSTQVLNKDTHTLVAHWTGGDVKTVSFMIDDDEYDNIPQTIGNNYQLPKHNPTDEYKTFEAWYDAKTGGNKITDSTPFTAESPTVLYAH